MTLLVAAGQSITVHQYRNEYAEEVHSIDLAATQWVQVGAHVRRQIAWRGSQSVVNVQLAYSNICCHTTAVKCYHSR